MSGNPLHIPESSPHIYSPFTYGVTGGGVSGGGIAQAKSPTIKLSAHSLKAWSHNNDSVLTASIKGGTTGTAVWAISDATGTLQINSSTGVVTVLDNTGLSGRAHLSVVISVSGVSPAVASLSVVINVNFKGGSQYQLLFAA